MKPLTINGDGVDPEQFHSAVTCNSWAYYHFALLAHGPHYMNRNQLNYAYKQAKN